MSDMEVDNRPAAEPEASNALDIGQHMCVDASARLQDTGFNHENHSNDPFFDGLSISSLTPQYRCLVEMSCLLEFWPAILQMTEPSMSNCVVQFLVLFSTPQSRHFPRPRSLSINCLPLQNS